MAARAKLCCSAFAWSVHSIPPVEAHDHVRGLSGGRSDGIEHGLVGRLTWLAVESAVPINTQDIRQDPHDFVSRQGRRLSIGKETDRSKLANCTPGKMSHRISQASTALQKARSTTSVGRVAMFFACTYSRLGTPQPATLLAVVLRILSILT